jgi:hypothetical protein
LGSVERLTGPSALSRAALARFVRPGSRSASQPRREVCLIAPPPLDTTPDVEADTRNGVAASPAVCYCSCTSTTTRSDPGARLRRPHAHSRATVLGQCQRWRIISQEFLYTRAYGQIRTHRRPVCVKSSGTQTASRRAVERIGRSQRHLDQGSARFSIAFVQRQCSHWRLELRSGPRYLRPQVPQSRTTSALGRFTHSLLHNASRFLGLLHTKLAEPTEPRTRSRQPPAQRTALSSLTDLTHLTPSPPSHSQHWRLITNEVRHNAAYAALNKLFECGSFAA